MIIMGECIVSKEDPSEYSIACANSRKAGSGTKGSAKYTIGIISHNLP